MKDDPEIIKRLRQEEKIGTLQSKTQHLYKEIQSEQDSDEIETAPAGGFMDTEDQQVPAEASPLPGLDATLYKKIFEASPEAIVVIDTKGSIVKTNDRTYDWLGYNSKELIGKNLSTLSFLPPESKKIIQTKYKQRICGHDVPPYEVEFLSKTKDKKVGRIYGVPIRNDNGIIIADLALISDVTKQKVIEKELMEKEDRYHDLSENANDLIQSVRPDGSFIYVNKKWKQTLEYSDKELSKLTVFDIIHPDSTEHCMKVFKKIMNGECIDAVETSFVTKKGKRIDVEGSISCRFQDGKPVSTRGIFRDITKRKHIEQRFKDQQEQWNSLVTNISDIVMLLDTKGTILSINHTFPGFTVEDTIGTSVYDYLPAEQQSKTKKALEQVISTGEPVRFETTVSLPEGDAAWYSTRLSPIIEDGTVVRVTQISTDITERKQAEEALRQSEEEYRTLFEAFPESIMRVNNKGIITSVNHAITDLFGYDVDGLVGKHFSKTGFIKKRNVTLYLKVVKAILGGKQLDPFEAEVWCKDGRKAIAEIYPRVIKKNGKVDGFIAIGRDVTDRKQAEEALRQSEEQYRALFESSADGILIANSKTRTFVDANPAICNLLGYARDELCGMSIQDIHPKERLDYVFSEFEAQSKGKKTLAINIPCLRKDGSIFYADVNSTSITIDGVKHVVGLFRDMTVCREAEGQLKEKLGELEQFKKVTVGRELKMIELKKQVTELEKRLKEGR